MATQEQPISRSNPPISPEALREKLLRPFPSISLRSIVLLLVIVLGLAWCWDASRPSDINRVSGIMDAFNGMAGLLKLMVPPEFELQSGTITTINLFGQAFKIGWPIVVSAVVVTVQMAVIGTLGAVLMSLPISLLAARNTAPHPLIYQSVRFILNFLRSIPELVVALLFVAAVGLGPFPGVLALAFGSVGSLSRVYSEAIEQIDPQQVMALRAAGAGGVQTFIYAVIPQALPLLISYSLVYFEHNVRTATILGYVGAGGIGYLLFEYMGFSAYPKVFGTVIVLVVAVTMVDRFSSSLRKRFI
ncbi:MAG TPA: phosphonate ABC transporter, permease protein PhnE [Phototrophicaceae bacterium]|nr:phosphonate ABC transporter, permease protein PhnE [Phototrophicaceae bacterium]